MRNMGIKRTSWLAGCVSLIAVLSLMFQPRMQATLFPSTRITQLTRLALTTKAARSVDPFLFWQIRDEFGAGFFTLDTNHTIFRETQSFVLPPRSEWVKFATYHAKRVESHDYLTPWMNIPRSQYPEILDQITEAHVGPDRSIFQDEDTRVFITKDNKMVVAFLKPISEMAKVYGLYNFPDNERDMYQGRMWANVTIFSPDCCTTSLHNLTESASIDKH